MTTVTNSLPTSSLKGGMTAQGSSALLLQNYALAMERQPRVDLSAHERLKAMEGDINATIDNGKNTATTYLNSVQPAILDRFAEMDRYFNMQVALPKVLVGKDRAQALTMLRAIEDRAVGYQAAATDTVRTINVLRESLSKDAAAFATHTEKLNSIVSGDNGVLAELTGQIADIDGKIAGAIAATALGGLAIAGGVFVFAVGSIAGFVTAGTSVPVAVAGATLFVGGLAAVTGGGIAIGALVNQKGEMLRQKASLESEVRLALTMKSGFDSLAASASAAASGAQAMSVAWSDLAAHLGSLAKDLEAGRLDGEDLIEFWVATAEGDIANVKADLDAIRWQFRNAGQVAAPTTDLVAVSEAARKQANDNTAARRSELGLPPAEEKVVVAQPLAA